MRLRDSSKWKRLSTGEKDKILMIRNIEKYMKRTFGDSAFYDEPKIRAHIAANKAFYHGSNRKVEDGIQPLPMKTPSGNLFKPGDRFKVPQKFVDEVHRKEPGQGSAEPKTTSWSFEQNNPRQYLPPVQSKISTTHRRDDRSSSDRLHGRELKKSRK